MDRSIWKYPLEIKKGPQTLALPLGAVPLSAQMQHGTLCLWVLVEPDAPSTLRKFEVFGTGWSIPEDIDCVRSFIATTQTATGSFVWHVFENVPCEMFSQGSE